MMGIFPTGSARERAVFRRALNRASSEDDKEADSKEEPPRVEMKMEEVKTKKLWGNEQLFNARWEHANSAYDDLQ